MGATKSHHFTKEQLRVAQLAKAIGHPARIAILEFLLKQRSCYCGDIVEELPLSQATVSQHLKALKEAGLVKGDIEGAKTCYCIDEKAWRETAVLLGILFERFEKTGNGCC